MTLKDTKDRKHKWINIRMILKGINQRNNYKRIIITIMITIIIRDLFFLYTVHMFKHVSMN